MYVSRRQLIAHFRRRQKRLKSLRSLRTRLPGRMTSAIVLLCLLFIVCVALKRDYGRCFDEAELDLKNSAQLSCSKSTQFTTLHPNLFYVDYPVPIDSVDSILSNFSKSDTGSRVIHARISTEEIEENLHMPVTLTGANIGIGLGLTNGTSKTNATLVSALPILYLLPMQHPRQNGSLCVLLGQLAERGISSFYEYMRHIYKLSHVTIVNNVILHADGMVALQCGWLQPRMGCQNRILRTGRLWRKNITKTIEATSYSSRKEVWQSTDTMSKAYNPSLPTYDEVFVINALGDYNFYHFLSDSLTRMVRFYHYLQRNPQVKIQIRLDEMMGYNASDVDCVTRAEQGRIMRARVLSLLEISPDRIVSGSLYARKLYLPNDIECASSPRHSMDLRLLSKLLVHKAERTISSGFCSLPIDATFRSPLRRNKTDNSFSRTVILPVRGTKVLVQARTCKKDWRCLNETVAGDVVRAAAVMFPNSVVVSANTSLSRGLACDIDLYRNADVVIGAHGAAMTNIMFMRPGTVLVEIVGAFDMRIPPVCGFYGPFAAVFGVHHYIYYYDGDLPGASLDVPDLLTHAFQFYTAIRTNASYTVYNVPFSK